MGRLATTVKKNADRTVRKAAMAIDQAVVMGTPVDTGRARANWIASINIPSDATTDSTDANGAIVQAAGEIGRYDGEKHESINISNNLPYIRKLNEGSSAQAPAQFVEEATKRAVKSVQGAKLLKAGNS